MNTNNNFDFMIWGMIVVFVFFVAMISYALIFHPAETAIRNGENVRCSDVITVTRTYQSLSDMGFIESRVVATDGRDFPTKGVTLSKVKTGSTYFINTEITARLQNTIDAMIEVSVYPTNVDGLCYAKALPDAEVLG